MSDGDLLLKAILEFPADDFPRLQLADWLEEHGAGERAEFIRVQCELADYDAFRRCCAGNVDSGHILCPVDGWGLRRRERELLNAHGQDWLRDFPLAVSEPIRNDLFRRGFVEQVTCTAADWLSHAAAILASQPVTKVTLTTWTYEDQDRLFDRVMEKEPTPWPPLRAMESLWPGIEVTLPPTHLAVGAQERLAAWSVLTDTAG